MKSRLKSILFFLLFISGIIISQTRNNIEIITDQNFDLRKTCEEYFGEPDLWPYVLKYNNYNNLSEVHTGSKIIIPVQKIKNVISKIDGANKSIQSAVNAGAKILAGELLENAITSYNNAVHKKMSYEFDLAEKYASEAIVFAFNAEQKTKEIRNRTIDAIISFKKGTVQKRFPSVLRWENVEIYDNLKEKDWARTLALSLADITFYDLSQIKLNGNSQAVIEMAKHDPLENKTTTKVRLEKGDAYAKLFSSPKKKFDLDIQGVKTKINSKYFWVEKNEADAKLANYNGEIALQVSDSAVVVQKNQGSVIPKGGFPTKPKDLFPPPVTKIPENLASFKSNEITFEWTKVNGASGYWVEIAEDPNFKILVSSTKNIKSESVIRTNFKDGVYYWRVCSMDQVGLPGPYSNYSAFVVALDKRKPYLRIDSPASNSIITSDKVKISGQTEPGATITINSMHIRINDYGSFEYDLLLSNGENNVIIEALNENRNKNTAVRNVYYELNKDIVIVDKNFGLLSNGVEIVVDEAIVKFDLITLPYSRVEFVADKINIFTYADSTGYCKFSVKLSKEKERCSLIVNSIAGDQKQIAFNVVVMNNEPRLILDSHIPHRTGIKELTISGSSENTEKIFINEKHFPIDLNNRFNAKLSLNSGSNEISINLVATDGKTKDIKYFTNCDDQPPRLLSYEIKNVMPNESVYKIIIKAADASELKKSAEVLIGDNLGTQKELLLYNPIEKVYEGLIVYSGSGKPSLINVVLEDYAANKKTFLIDNRYR